MESRLQDSSQAESPIAIPYLTLPKGGGSVGYSEAFRQNAFTGAANFSIPIPTPAARATALGLELNYVSGGGNGPFGLGFMLQLPVVSVRTSHGIPRYDGDQVYLLNGDVLVPRYDQQGGAWVPAERVVQQQGVSYRVVSYRNRSEGTYDRIEQWIDQASGLSFWQIADRANRLTVLGRSDAARIADTRAPQRIFTWLVEQQIDAHGNQVLYSYRPEDDVGLSPTQARQNSTANRYLERIQYGNYTDAAGAEQVAFEVIFDYGERDLDQPTLAPATPWQVRPDPFSSFRTGFEIRTNRICAGILVTHCFPDELGPEPVIVDVVKLGYDASQGISLLQTIIGTGFRRDTDGVVRQKSQAPLRLGYVPWAPDKHIFCPLQVTPAGALPGLIGSNSFQMVDLYGDGLPGIFAVQGPALSYWRPDGNGQYLPGASPLLFPINTPKGTRAAALLDIDGNGRLDIVVAAPGRAGYFSNNNDTTWAPFQPFDNAPTDLSDLNTLLVDLTGAGRADLLSSGQYQWRVALSEGTDGFVDPVIVPTPDGISIYRSDDEATFVGFADIFGDGLQHLVRVTTSRVQVWPNLGYGRFGTPREIFGAPAFGPSLTNQRVLLSDLNGSGAADLILIYPDRVDIHPNLYGNTFGPAISIALPDGLSALDTATTADVLGLGAGAIVISQMLPAPRQRYLDTCGGALPFLLSSIDNGVGAVTTITYRSSSAYALADRQAGTPWATTLAMPVQVVAQVETNDGVDGSTQVQVYQYRDGYYDPVEREFRGFGMVQSQDTTTFNNAVWHFPSATTAPASQLEPLLSRGWNLTGADLRNAAIVEQLAAYYFQADPQALLLPEPTFDPAIFEGGGELLRQAFMALASRIYRTEEYGVQDDGLPKPAPYRIEQSAFAVRLVQPIIDGSYAVFQVVEQETASSIYEAVAQDPRIAHRLQVAIDDFGQPFRTVELFYRRRPALATNLPGQIATACRLRTSGLINHVDGSYINSSGGPIPPLHEHDGLDYHLLGIPFEERAYEVAGFAEPALYIDYAQAQALAEEALANAIDYGASFTPGTLQARLFEWSQNLYWDAALSQALPLQEIGTAALIHHSQQAVLSALLIAAVFGSRVDAAMLQQQGGYQAQDDYWWSWGNVATYFGAAGFYQIRATADPYGNTISVTYDTYQLSIASQTDPAGYMTTVVMDYQALKPASITDINQNISEALYDPQAQLMATSLYRIQDGTVVGDTPLAQYRIIDNPTTADVLANPTTYLQGAGHYFYEDLTAWADQTGQPPHTVLLERHIFAHPEASLPGSTTASAPFGLAIAFFDGKLRQLSIARLVNGDPPYSAQAMPAIEQILSANAPCWLVDRRVRYDTRGDVAVRYLPFFTTTPAFVAAPDVPYEEHFYDALARPIQTLTAKGFLTYWRYAAWNIARWDEDDTVTESPYYKAHIQDPNLPLAQRQALEKAAVFENTPQIKEHDVLGREIQHVQLLVQKAGEQPTYLYDYHWLDAAGNTIASTDPRFYNAAAPNEPASYTRIASYDMAQHAIDERSADAGNAPLTGPQSGIPKLTLYGALEQAVEQWDTRGFQISKYYNQLRQLISVHATGNGLDQDIELLQYGDNASLQTIHRVVAYYDQAGVTTIPAYTLNGDPTGHTRRFRTEFAGEANWNAPGSVSFEPETWSTTFSYDAIGNILAIITPDGSRIDRTYYRNSWLMGVSATPPGAAIATQIVKPATYIASGDPATLAFANGVTTHLSYEPETFRLTSIVSTLADGSTIVQDLGYTYDPHGNVTFLANATPIPGLKSSSVDGNGDYTFDSLYHLIGATGRQATSAEAGEECGGAPQPEPPTIEPYTQSFIYDTSGNLTTIDQQASQPWTLEMAVSDSSDHAVPQATLGGKAPDDFFDAAGNLTTLQSGATLSYDAQDRLIQAQSAASAATYFQNSWINHRTRKVVASGGSNIETLYIDDLIVERPLAASGQAVPGDTATMSLRISFGDRLAALAVFPPANAQPEWRYQLTDRLWSVGLELDDQANVLHFEEFQPYGSSAISITPAGGTTLPRYRYIQQELDPSTELYAIGRRYYIPAQGRWISPDPAGDVDGQNLFMYVRGNPVTEHDVSGENGDPPGSKQEHQNDTYTRTKYALKSTNVLFTGLNALFDAFINNRELVNRFAYPYSSKTNMSVWTSAFHGAILSKVGFFAVGAGLSGSFYAAMSIKKEGFNRSNSSLLVGNLAFMAEGGTLYQAMAATGHHFHALMKRASIIGTIADTSKAYSYFIHGDYGTAFMYTLLAGGNLAASIDKKTRLSMVRKMMRMAPLDRAKIAFLARGTRPGTLLLAAASIPIFQSFITSLHHRMMPHQETPKH